MSRSPLGETGEHESPQTEELSSSEPAHLDRGSAPEAPEAPAAHRYPFPAPAPWTRARATPSGTTSAAPSEPGVGPWLHAAFAIWAMTGLAAAWGPAPVQTALRSVFVGEDRFVEWLTVTLFAAAGFWRMRSAIASRSLFDGLVALFCLFVAGEEFSWGQRLFGYTPPAFFLENSHQQEANVHNLVEAREILSYALAGFAFILPLLARFAPTRSLMVKLGATPPSPGFAPWFAVAIIMIQWDPTRVTGEWAESLAASLFFAGAVVDRRTGRGPSGTRITPHPWAGGAVFSSAVAGAFALTLISDKPRATTETLAACALEETAALARDLAGGALTPTAVRSGVAEQRIWRGATLDRTVDWSKIRAFHEAPCGDEAAGDVAERRRFAVDPWGNAYVMYVKPISSDSTIVRVVSAGPNRRWEQRFGVAAKGGDDVATEVVVR